VPADVAAIVDRALMYEKKDRFPDARTMRAAVRAALAARDRAAPLPFATAPTVAAVSSSGGETLLTSETASRAAAPTRVRAIAIACGAAAAAIALAVALLAGGGSRAGSAASAVTADPRDPSASASAPSPPPPVVAPAATSAEAPAPPGSGGTTLDVDALPDSTRGDATTGPRPPASGPAAPEGSAKSKKRRNLGF
jgi:eukaryotic-like serine/threonine-protein kinase